ncbi:MAG: efflux RND transporter periplasmic adaptor subunit [Verrucomicrobia bacterium]|nr:MAG: efflux RND transporter periplasmic adaptor subunit [Verrucomicrobiota bacterium]
MKWLRFLVPVGILAVSGGVVWWLMATRPEPERRGPPPMIQVVEVMPLVRTNHQVILRSQGIVRPRTLTTLKPEVSGRIVWVAPAFREGGFFEEGEVLLRIDSRDYTTAVVTAQAELKLRESALQVAEAEHEQAVENWRLLGDGSTPSPLTLREPQLAEARAAVESAKARLEQALRNLERTQIRAPFAGRIQRKMVDLGQVVSPNSDLATMFAIDFVEIRLPLQNDQLDFIRLPEEYRGPAGERPPPPKVLLHGRYGSRDVTWEGRIVRAEGAYDQQTRELFVIAQVDDPYAWRGPDEPPLKVGQFVTAEIFGETLTNVFVLPRTALRPNGEVLIVDGQNRIHRRVVPVMWKDPDQVVVCTGLEEGELLCVTPMVFAADGAEVQPMLDGKPLRGGQPNRPGPLSGPGGPALTQGAGKPDHAKGDGAGATGPRAARSAPPTR